MQVAYSSAIAAAVTIVLAASAQGQVLTERLVLFENTDISRGDQRGRVLVVETPRYGSSQKEIFIVTPEGSKARIFEDSDPLDDRWRYVVSFLDSSFESELWYESSLSYEGPEDMFNVAYKMRDQIEAGNYEVMTKFTLGPQVYAKARGPFLQLSQIAVALAPQIEETAILGTVPSEVCDVVSFLTESRAVLGGGNMDVLWGLITYVTKLPRSIAADSAEADGNEPVANCASTYEARYSREHGDWEVQKSQELVKGNDSLTKLPRSWRDFRESFTGKPPKLRMKSPN